MHLHNSQARAAIRLVLVGTVFLSISAGMVMDVVADNFGYVSPNPSDLPPVLDRDVSLRSVDPNRPPAYGPEDAKVLVIIFADFQCPACRRASQATHQIAGEFPGEVRMEFWNKPLPSHRNADLAAAAAISAQRQGRFWEMHDILFENPKHDVATLEQHAQELGLDLAQFRSDMNDIGVNERIREQVALADALGAGPTPSYFINGRLYLGWGSWLSFRQRVERELAEANALAEQGMDSFEIRSQRALDNHADSESYELYRLGILQPDITATSE